MATFTAGFNSVVKIGTAGSEVDYSAISTTADFERMVAELKNTVFGNTAEGRQPGLLDSTFKVTVQFDLSTLATLEGLVGVAGKSLIWAPLGTTTGNPKYQVNGFIKKIAHKSAVAALVTADIEWAPNGVVTVSTF